MATNDASLLDTAPGTYLVLETEDTDGPEIVDGPFDQSTEEGRAKAEGALMDYFEAGHEFGEEVWLAVRMHGGESGGD